MTENLPAIWLIPSLSKTVFPFGWKFISKVISLSWSGFFFTHSNESKKSSYWILNPWIQFLEESEKTPNLLIILRPLVFFVLKILVPSSNLPITSFSVLIISLKTIFINLLKLSFWEEFVFHLIYADIKRPNVMYFLFGPHISWKASIKSFGSSLDNKGPKHFSKRKKEEISLNLSKTK